MDTVLEKIYQTIFNGNFNKENEKHRKCLQYTIYLIENMDVIVGDYGFFLYKGEVYSQTLQNDILRIGNKQESINFSNKSIEVLNKLKEYYDIAINNKINVEDLFKNISSVYYLKNRNFMDNENILQKLSSENYSNDNIQIAINIVNQDLF